MTMNCAACDSPIVSFTSEDTPAGVTNVAAQADVGFYDGVVGYCSEECAPSELTSRTYDTPPLHELVKFFHDSNTDESLEYWTEERGWKKETVDELLLGWAPTDEYAAFNYLKDKGYSNADILSTGAFYPGNTPYSCIWKGRFVFPYYDSEGFATYLISRRMETEMSDFKDVDSSMLGHPSDDRGAQKYSKLTKTKPYAIHDEPIYGAESITDANHVLIAEGIADAITAIELDYPVLSPVTVSFKDKHYSEVSNLITEHGIEQVFIVPDAEEVQESQEESGVDVSVGLYGGLKTAVELEERVSDDVAIRVVELPRGEDVSKMDLDEYLQTQGTEAFDDLMVNARNPDEFDAYEEIKEKVQKMKKAAKERRERGSFDSDGNHSELFDISILDVLPSGFDPDSRNPNPLGHLGDSENYFAVTDVGGDFVGYDHKRKVSYNALTYILCEIDERSPDSPNGSLSDKEVWLAWKWCKENGIFMNEEDPIPSSALNHIARELGYDVSSDEMLPYSVYSEALGYVDEEYDLHPGREATGSPNESDNSNKSGYFTWPVEAVVSEIDSSQSLPKGFEFTGETWTSDIVDEPANSLALIAVLEGFLEEDEVSLDWTSKVSNKEFLEICLLGRDKYYITARKPPYKTLLGIADVLGVDEYYDEDEEILKHSDKVKFQTVYEDFYYDDGIQHHTIN